MTDAYLYHKVKRSSLWIKPSKIGKLPDDKPHHVAFTIPGTPHFCSNARPLRTKGDFDEFSKEIENSLYQKGKSVLLEENLWGLANDIKTISEKREDISERVKRMSEEIYRDKHPLDTIAFYASVFLNCQLFVVSEKGENELLSSNHPTDIHPATFH